MQRVVHRDETLCVGRQAGFPGPRRSASRRHPENFVQFEPGSVATFDQTVSRAADRAVRMDIHAAVDKQVTERGTHAPVVGRQDIRPVGDERVRQMVSRPILFRQESTQAILYGQQEFDAARAAADHADVRGSRSFQASRTQRFPVPPESIDRLDRHTHAVGTGNVRHGRRGTDVDGQYVVGYRRPVLADNLFVRRVEAGRLGVEKPRACEPAQRHEVDMRVVEAVVARDVAGQHPRVGRMRVAGNQRQTYARHRAHAELLQHRDVAVSSAYQDEVFDDRHGWVGVHRFILDIRGSDIRTISNMAYFVRMREGRKR